MYVASIIPCPERSAQNQNQLFIPGARVFGMTDKIPFHVQMSGPLASLKEFLLPTVSSTKKSQKRCPTEYPKPKVTVTVVRQINIETRGQKGWKNFVIGEAEISEVPPAIYESRGGVHLDYEGELQCHEDLTAGGFVLPNISVKVC